MTGDATSYCTACRTIDGCKCTPHQRKKNQRPPVDPFFVSAAEDAANGWTAAVNLAQTLHRLHYGPITTWRPLPTIAGVISQIDNMTAGMIRLPQHPDRYRNDEAAKALYDTWSDKPGWVPWVERGNSLMQERARREVTL